MTWPAISRKRAASWERHTTCPPSYAWERNSIAVLISTAWVSCFTKCCAGAYRLTRRSQPQSWSNMLTSHHRLCAQSTLAYLRTLRPWSFTHLRSRETPVLRQRVHSRENCQQPFTRGARLRSATQLGRSRLGHCNRRRTS